jgi:UDP-N-acetylglucosamine 1-carboxyvinyltransferase
MDKQSFKGKLFRKSYVSITGGSPLHGDVTISGYKHSAVMLMCAALLCEDGISRLSYIPYLKDVAVIIELAKILGCNYQTLEQKHGIAIDATNMENVALDISLLESVHGTIYLLPALLHRIGSSPLFAAGGCQLGANSRRSVKHILEILARMGAKIDSSQNRIYAPHGLKGANIDLTDRYPLYERSGCTKIALLAGSLADGVTVIHSPYFRREVQDLVLFLRGAGAEIEVEQNRILLNGKNVLHGNDYKLPTDFLEWATFVFAVASAGGEISIEPLPPLAEFSAEFDLISSCGIEIMLSDSCCRVCTPNPLSPVEVFCPPVISDFQPLIAAALCKAIGKSSVVDKEWEKRFEYMSGLQTLGAELSMENNTLTIQGPANLSAATLWGTDLRATTSLLIAALGASGTSQLYGIEHLERGYENIIEKLRNLGAVIY